MSQIDIYCPHCTQKLGMNREKFYASLGKKTQCPTCHKYMTLSQDLFHTFRDTSKKEKREPEIERQPRKENALDPNRGTTLKEYLETIWGPTGNDIFESILGLCVLVVLVYMVGFILIKSVKPYLGSPGKTVVTETRVITESRRTDPVSLFKEQVLNAAMERAKPTIFLIESFPRPLDRKNRIYGEMPPAAIARENKTTWFYEIYDYRISYDIIETKSLISPIIALVYLDPGTTLPHYEDGRHYLSREALREAPLQPRNVNGSWNSNWKGPFKYVFQNGTWRLSPTEGNLRYFGNIGAPYPLTDSLPKAPRNSEYQKVTQLNDFSEI